MITWMAGKNLMKHHYLIKKAFYSKFCLKDITNKDFPRAQKVFEEFRLKTLGDYDVKCDNKDFIKNYDKNSNKGYFLEVDFKYPKKCLIFINVFHF